MPYKTLAVILQSTEDTRRVLDSVLPLAQAWNAHVVGVHAEPYPVAYSAAVGFPDVTVIEAAAEAAEERTTEIEALFHGQMRAAGQSHEWHASRSFSGDTAYAGAALARTADLVIVAQRNPDWAADDASGVEGVLYEAGRPVLVVPHSSPMVRTFSRILLAWNGSRESARAAFDALPLIKEAESTEIFVVDPPAEGEDVEASASCLAAALSRHGAEVVVATEQSRGRHVDEVIRDRATAMGADLLVLGAYSHSWLRQLLFGGVTRTVLQSMQVPCLMSR
ncbi:universal stress protein [Pseudaminobacter sp. 19-2017]|uniref:Universal stress protein n=1 Tax=Pseudaminobacter soli (ex Zhang et al. 2022) TaxID=2831468 RepID=A0A942IBD7_9HYPH|nr:universal stress protein [Pseudaminobacter soli]MBS3652205.1 universal stress protein [Pseudaminobacter soli]